MSDFETVKQRADIVDVVGGYASLTRAGRYFKACCPFHTEKTPSFYVYPDQQSWHCFGACATGGDVISFVQKSENLTPVEALRLLAERYGVQLEGRQRAADEPKTNRLVEANEAAALYFHDLLLHAPAADPARAYIDRRGLDADTVRAFSLGFSPDTWDSLRMHLAGRGFSDEEQEAAGLLTRGENRVYDRFRGRLMFPIRDDRGRVIGFGGRVLGEGVPKYLNTPQTPLFDKGATLFALERAKEAIRAAGSAVVVEGYMDAITAHQFGIANVVATLGTALTERHIALLKRYTKKVVLSMDADAAGVEAALRGEELVRKAAEKDEDGTGHVVVDWRNLVRVQAAAPVEVRVFTVPQGKDPDEAIRTDPAAFRALTEQAAPPFEFRLRHELARIDRNDPRQRLELTDRMLPLVAAVADRAVQAQYLARLAEVTAIPEEVLAARMHASRTSGAAPLPLSERVERGAGRRARRGDAGGGPNAAPAPATGASAPPPRDPSAPPFAGPPDDDLPAMDDAPPLEDGPNAARAPGPPARGGVVWGIKPELTCLRLLLVYPPVRDAGLAIDPDLFTDPDNRALFLAWRESADEVGDRLDSAGRERLRRVLAERMAPLDDAAAARALEEIMARLRLRRLEDRTRMLAATLRETGAGSDAGSVIEALHALAGTLPAGAEGTEAATQLLTSIDLARDRHSLEVTLRTGNARRPPRVEQ